MIFSPPPRPRFAFAMPMPLLPIRCRRCLPIRFMLAGLIRFAAPDVPPAPAFLLSPPPPLPAVAASVSMTAPFTICCRCVRRSHMPCHGYRQPIVCHAVTLRVDAAMIRYAMLPPVPTILIAAMFAPLPLPPLLPPCRALFSPLIIAHAPDAAAADACRRAPRRCRAAGQPFRLPLRRLMRFSRHSLHCRCAAFLRQLRRFAARHAA